jgi:hypothetical protein
MNQLFSEFSLGAAMPSVSTSSTFELYVYSPSTWTQAGRSDAVSGVRASANTFSWFLTLPFGSTRISPWASA